MAGDVSIRHMVVSDAGAVGRLFFPLCGPIDAEGMGDEALRTAYVVETFGPGNYFSEDSVLVAEVGGKVVGICIAFREPCVLPPMPEHLSEALSGVGEAIAGVDTIVSWDLEYVGEGGVYVSTLAVDEGFRDMGVGRRLMDEALRGGGRAMLMCEADNEPALALYYGMGFVRVGFTFVAPEDDDGSQDLRQVWVLAREAPEVEV